MCICVSVHIQWARVSVCRPRGPGCRSGRRSLLRAGGCHGRSVRRRRRVEVSPGFLRRLQEVFPARRFRFSVCTSWDEEEKACTGPERWTFYRGNQFLTKKSTARLMICMIKTLESRVVLKCFWLQMWDSVHLCLMYVALSLHGFQLRSVRNTVDLCKVTI